MMEKKTIIPIASGKGGVGKSVLAANLAIALARMGHTTTAVDLDLGGANLYSCLGIPNRFPGIGDFMKSGNIKFNDLIIDTKIPNLKFLPGDGKTPFMADISFEQRRLLLKKIKSIPSRYVILDLGAGTVFNTLNFYGLAYKGIIITSFETSSIMNFIMFLKNFMLRVIVNVAQTNKKALDIMLAAFNQPISAESLTVGSMIDKIAKIDPQLAEHARKMCSLYRPRIVFNMGDHPDELNVLKKLDATIKQGLSIDADYFGFIFFDEAVRMSARKRTVLMTSQPYSKAAAGIKTIAERVATKWDEKLNNSMAELVKDARGQYEAFKR
ncbi:P-loop NTPase [Desulfobacterales bacterium HSG16]|nr:P-loop NTPase [Desulfobacterales bacterium HSG16]